MNSYKTVYSFGKDEFVVNKSRFIGYSKPISKEEDALLFIEEIKNMNKDATHNIYAYVFGENSIIQRYSDDGEPSGTAGIPALEVIRKENLKNVVVVVTRYFGGIKLGTGGLIRAYTKGAKIGLEAANIVNKVLYRKIKIRIDYNLYGKIENEIISQGFIIDDVIFDDKVNIMMLCEKEKVKEAKKLIVDYTSDTAYIEEIEDVYLTFKGAKRMK